MIVVVVALAIIFLPKIMPQLKGALGGLGGGTMTQTQTGSGGTNVSKSTCKNGDCNIDVSGNGCACANGVCKGNCSDMEKIDLENFDPLDWVQQQA